MTGIIILNYETWELTLRCIKNIGRTQKKLSYHIYLVDNASAGIMPIELSEYLSAHKYTVTYLRAEDNRGYAAGNNIGIRQAILDGCESLVITNNDILFQEDAVQKLVDRLDDRSRIGITGPKVMDAQGRIQPSRCSMYTGIREVFQLFTAAKVFFGKKQQRYYCLDQNPDEPADVYYVSGCCFAVSRACAMAVMPLDEGTILYYEEIILGIRMRQAGYRTRYEPSSTVIHQHGGTTRRVQPFMHQCISRSELYYLSRYLRAHKWQLWLLYHYRRSLYLLRCIRNQDFRSYWKEFDRQTRKWYEDLG